MLPLENRIYNSQFSIPIEFEKSNQFDFSDERFMPVKIWIAHTGENRNNSIFTKESLEFMASSLSNVPILGFLADTDENVDFLGHEQKISVKDGKVDIQYLGRAYGLIPESNNARFEFRYGKDGKEREYLVCDGIIWNKFKEVPQIFDRDSGFKNQSMELFPSSIKGKFNDHGLFVYEEAKVEGACMLGENVNPAMISSTIEKFSVDTHSNSVTEMIKEFNRLFSEIRKEGGNELDKQIETVEEKVETTVVEEDEEKETGGVDTEDTEVKESEETVEQAKETEDQFSEKPMIRTFEISHNDIRQDIYNQLDDHDALGEHYSYIIDVYDSHAIVENGDSFYKVNYVKHESAVSLGEYEELFPMFLNKVEKESVDNARKSIEQLESELANLKEFKEKSELADKEEVLSQYSETLNKESYEAIKSKFSDLSVEDVKKEIGLVLLENNHFSTKEQVAKATAIGSTGDTPYGEASVFFTK